MSYKIVEVDRFLVAGIAVRTSNNEQGVKEIGATWEKFLSEGYINTIPFPCDKKAYGVYTNYEADFSGAYDFAACIKVSEKIENEEIKYIQIPTGKYAKFTIVGHMQTAAAKLWEEIWKSDLNRAYGCDFEVYHNDSNNIKKQTIDLYIQLKD